MKSIKPEDVPVTTIMTIVEAGQLLDTVIDMKYLLEGDAHDDVIIQILETVGLAQAMIEYMNTNVDKTGEFE
tara:strand:+ start:6094 stop:6309 length:216 start_codon:yes stop_codon:yes gene_type:complete